MREMPVSSDASLSGHVGERAARDPSGPALVEIYRRLRAAYGPQHWWPGESPLETIVGAILTQGTAWTNVERALDNLKRAGLLSAPALRDIPESELAIMLRPSGFYNAKARKVKAFIEHLWDRHGGDLKTLLAQATPELRKELLTIYGIGEETADDIIVYAAGKPSFVVDAYTRRILGRLKVAPDGGTYSAYQDLFHRGLPPDATLFNEYHALLDMHGKGTCKVVPLCAGCCLLGLCPTGKASVDTSDAQSYNYPQTEYH